MTMSRILFAVLFCIFLNDYASAAQYINADDAHVAQMGRIDNTAQGAVRFSYPGVSFFVDVEGSNLSIEALSSGKDTFLEVIVDGGPAQPLRLSDTLQTVTLMSKVEAGRHHIELIHRSETWHGIATIKGWQTDGQFLAAPILPARKILILGDSVSCGEAIARDAGQSKTSAWWNPRLSYGMLTAQALRAQVQLVCYGGRGLLRSWNGNTNDLNLPDFLSLTIPDPDHPVQWDAKLYAADVILVAIGTNDFSSGIPESEKYIAAYMKLLKTLLMDYPHAQIGITEGAILNGKNKEAMIGFLAESAHRLQNRRIHQLASQYYPGDERDGHPSKEQHNMMANALIAQLKTMMDWSAEFENDVGWKLQQQTKRN